MKKSKLLIIMTTIVALTSCVSTPSSTKENKKDTVSSGSVAENESSDLNADEEEVVLVIDEESPHDDIEKAKEKEAEAAQKAADKAFINSLKDVNIKIANAPREATVGNEFVRPFTIVVENTADDTNKPVADFPLTISYPTSKLNGNLVYTTEEVTTDENGTYVFTAPRTSFSAAGYFSAYPTYTPYPGFEGIEPAEEIKNIIEEKSAITNWLVKSDLANRGGILVLWQFNEAGRFSRNFPLISELRSRNIRNVTNAPFSDESFINESLENVYSQNKEILVASEMPLGYMIYGTIKYVSRPAPTEDGQYSCKMIADIQSINLKDGSVVLQKVFEQEGIGRNYPDCVTKCEEKLASKIVDALLYEM